MSVNDIRNIMEKYIEGTNTTDVSLLESIFHDNAIMSGWLGSEMIVGSPEPFFRFLNNSKISPNYHARIENIWTEGPVATAVIREENLLGMNFVNQFQLIQQNGVWLITAKLFGHD